MAKTIRDSNTAIFFPNHTIIGQGSFAILVQDTFVKFTIGYLQLEDDHGSISEGSHGRETV